MSPPISSTPPDAATVSMPGPPGRHALHLVFLALVASVMVIFRTEDRGLFTAHEARAARCARHMLRSHAWPAEKPSPWLVPQFSPDAPPGLAYQKPPLYYWAVAGVSVLAGEVTPLTVRLPSAAAFVLLVLITYGLGRTLVSSRTGFIAALVLLSTPKMLWWGRSAILDPMLVACIAGAMLFFARAWRGRGGEWQYWLFWALVGLGTLVKATSLVVPLLAVGLLLLARMRQDGLWRPIWRLKPITGPLVLLAVAAPWHVAAHLETGGEFSRIYWGIHVFGRAAGTSVFEDTTDWWYYLAAMARDFFPWIVFLPGALVQPWRAASRAHRGRLLLPFVWFVGSLVFFSAVAFRKDEYLLAAYPAAALLVGYLLDYHLFAHRTDRAMGRWIEAAFWILAFCAAAAAVAVLAYAFVPALREGVLARLDNQTDQAVWGAIGDLFASRVWIPLALGLVPAGGALAAALAVRRGRPAPAVGLLVAAMLATFLIFTVTLGPVLNETRDLESFCDRVRAEGEARGPGTTVLLAADESHQAALYLGLEETPTSAALAAVARRPDGALVVMDEDEAERILWNEWNLRAVQILQTSPGHREPMVLLLVTRAPSPEQDP